VASAVQTCIITVDLTTSNVLIYLDRGRRSNILQQGRNILLILVPDDRTGLCNTVDWNREKDFHKRNDKFALLSVEPRTLTTLILLQAPASVNIHEESSNCWYLTTWKKAVHSENCELWLTCQKECLLNGTKLDRLFINICNRAVCGRHSKMRKQRNTSTYSLSIDQVNSSFELYGEAREHYEF
jgi:hypothetical protein